jgi:hypothetical protein
LGQQSVYLLDLRLPRGIIENSLHPFAQESVLTVGADRPALENFANSFLLGLRSAASLCAYMRANRIFHFFLLREREPSAPLGQVALERIQLAHASRLKRSRNSLVELGQRRIGAKPSKVTRNPRTPMSEFGGFSGPVFVIVRHVFFLYLPV